MSRPRPKIDPRALLEKALQLIEEELYELKDASDMGKLDPNNTTALIRYSEALLKFVKDDIVQEEEDRKKAAKMSNEELAELAAKMAAKKG